MEATRDRHSRFVCNRLNDDTFLIVEHDSYDEHPFIYVKVYHDPPLLVLSDTGCGGVYTQVTSPSANTIRDYIETHPVLDNDNKPLNPHDRTGKPEKQYLIICTHCHYDHILGLPYFADTSPIIVASSYGKSFVTEDLAEHSLCKHENIAVPEYTVTNWAGDFEELSVDGHDLHIQVIHTPGHTPDELAWFDERVRHLYVGDSFYERVAKDKSYEQAIVFPKEGNLIHFMQSLDKLIHFLSRKDAEEGKGPIKIACGHITSAAPGKDILVTVKTVFSDLLKGNVPIVSSTIKRGEQYHVWKSDGDTRFSIEAPLRLVQDARQAAQKSVEWLGNE
ncbi:hypothetical protein G7Y79_00054g089320 [Physcia stellaris]|nr:hypothetical protein G7Y79_00054g089320 [Physcia stellaris]